MPDADAGATMRSGLAADAGRMWLGTSIAFDLVAPAWGRSKALAPDG